MTEFLQCKICDLNAPTEQFKTYESDCLFVQVSGINQHLVRHECPNCGVIFGPQDMLNLTKQQLIEAYHAVYNTGYRDCDSSEVELKALMTLNPKTDGVYLNWGAGTSTASDKAKLRGYTLINYDPFTPDITPNVKLDISTNKYDGIISNNLLEHLQDPVSEMKLMKSLLKPGGEMVHITDCFMYCIEYTKYHLFFFQGKSLQTICDKIGMNYVPCGNTSAYHNHTNIIKFK
jgi:SAM-dependent methyltransferase